MIDWRRRFRAVAALPLLGLCVLGWVGCGESVPEDEVLHLALRNDVKTLDPIRSNEEFAKRVVAQIYEPLLQYHYLKRPFKLEPLLADSMPSVSDDGLTYTIKIKKGVLFQNDECFPDGQGRELTASDFVYAWKRLGDAKLKGQGYVAFEGKVKGFDAFRDASRGNSPTDYSQNIEGFEVVDNHTLKIHLEEPYPQLLSHLAIAHTAPVAKEAVDKYGADFGEHPVGTGPYRLDEGGWVRQSSITLVANENFRNETYPDDGTQKDFASGMVKDKGVALPLTKKVTFHVITEAQTRYLKFMNGELDFALIEKDQFPQFFENERVKAEHRNRFEGMLVPQMDMTFHVINMDDPLLGKNKKLRQAMSLARNWRKRNLTLYAGTAAMAHSIIPKGLPEYDPEFRSEYRAVQGDFERAKELLAEAGYPGGEGLPEFVFECHGTTDARQKADNVVQDWAQIGIKCRVNSSTWSQFLEKTRNRQAQVFGLAWSADYPDVDDFMKLVYSGNASPGDNSSNYSNPEVDALYEKLRTMESGPEKTKLCRQIAEIVADDCPVLPDMMRQRGYGYGKWLRNFKPSQFVDNDLKYLRLDQREAHLQN